MIRPMIFYFTRHHAAPHVFMKVKGFFDDKDTPPAFTSGSKMFSNLVAFTEAADAAHLSDDSLVEVYSFAAASENLGECESSDDIEISEAQLLSMGFTLEHGKERRFVVSYVGQERPDGQKAVVVTAKERDPLPLGRSEVRKKPMLLVDLNEKLRMIERTYSTTSTIRPSGPNLPQRRRSAKAISTTS